MNRYERRFYTLLEQDLNVDDLSPDQGADSAANKVVDNLAPDDLGATGVDDQIQQAAAMREEEMVTKIKSWVQELDRFTHFLNDPDANSIQSTLKKAVPDTILDKIRSTETKKIARTAMDLAALSEVLKGYLATSRDAKYRYV